MFLFYVDNLQSEIATGKSLNQHFIFIYAETVFYLGANFVSVLVAKQDDVVVIKTGLFMVLVCIIRCETQHIYYWHCSELSRPSPPRW